MDIKLIALDLDGTLLCRDKTVCQETKTAMEEISALGVELVISTGRSLLEFRPYLEQLPMVHYAVTCGGACVVDCKTEEILGSSAMELGDVITVYEILKDSPVYFELFTQGKIFVPQDRLDNQDYYMEFTNSPPLSNTRTGMENFSQFLKDLTSPVDKIHMYFRDGQIRDTWWDAIAHLPLPILKTDPVDLEIAPNGVDKGTGLSMLAKRLGLEQSQVMAIGDSFNDEGMLRYAGVSVVMENGEPEMKALADFVTTTNDNQGVARVLRRLMEGKCSWN